MWSCWLSSWSQRCWVLVLFLVTQITWFCLLKLFVQMIGSTEVSSTFAQPGKHAQTSTILCLPFLFFIFFLFLRLLTDLKSSIVQKDSGQSVRTNRRFQEVIQYWSFTPNDSFLMNKSLLNETSLFWWLPPAVCRWRCTALIPKN